MTAQQVQSTQASTKSLQVQPPVLTQLEVLCKTRHFQVFLKGQSQHFLTQSKRFKGWFWLPQSTP